eukprot:scaffold78994_cov28-Phaeocystis_antarctica.AAC.1
MCIRDRVEGVHRLDSLGYQVGPSEPHMTTSGRATYTIPVPTDEVVAECHRVIAFFGVVLNQAKLRMHVGVGSRHKIQAVLTYIWREA